MRRTQQTGEHQDRLLALKKGACIAEVQIVLRSVPHSIEYDVAIEKQKAEMTFVLNKKEEELRMANMMHKNEAEELKRSEMKMVCDVCGTLPQT